MEGDLVFSLIRKSSDSNADFHRAVSIMREVGQSYPDITSSDGKGNFKVCDDGYIFKFKAKAPNEQRLLAFNNALRNKFEKNGYMKGASTQKIGSDNNSKNESDCFVATAIFENPNAQEVQLLRTYRDRFLRKTTMGMYFIQAYYIYGPLCATFVKKISSLKWLLKRVFITFIVPFAADQIKHSGKKN